MLIADDHALYRRGLVIELDEADDLEVVAEAANGEEAVEQAIALAPDVVLMDVRMPGGGGVAATRTLLHHAPTTRVLMLSGADEGDDLVEAIKAGAAGYLLKETSIEQIGESVRMVARGHSFVSPELAGRLLTEFAAMARRVEAAHGVEPRDPVLSTREIDMLNVMAQGADNAEIARLSDLTEHAVRNHVRNILQKLQLASRTEAVLYAVRTQLIDP